MFRGEGEQGFSLVRAWLGPHYVLPRHTHSGDCLYYIVEGSITMGSQQLVAGDGFCWFPRTPPTATRPDLMAQSFSSSAVRHRSTSGSLAANSTRWQRMAEVAAVYGQAWAESRSDGVS